MESHLKGVPIYEFRGDTIQPITETLELYKSNEWNQPDWQIEQKQNDDN
jgi:hypothetical protein